MKVKVRESTEEALPTRTTTIAPTELEGIVSITHHQGIKQSILWQSADAGYSIRVNCPDNDKAIRKSVKRMEKLIESMLVEKIKQQSELLQILGKKNQ